MCLVTVGVGPAVTAQEDGDPGVVESPGPYLDTEAPVIDAPKEPRKPMDHDLPSSDVATGQEVVDQRTATSKTFAGAEPGVFETRLYGAPVHFQDSGEWVEIDTDLVDVGEGRVGAKASDLHLSIAPTAGDSELVQVDLPEGGSLS